MKICWARGLIVAVPACIVLVSGAPLAQAGEPTLAPADALRLMKLDEQLQVAEEDALAADAEYQAVVAETEAVEAKAREHRAAFEAQRDADPEYAQLKRKFDDLTSRSESLDMKVTEVAGTNHQATRELRAAQGKARKLRSAINGATQRRDTYQDRYDRILAAWKAGDEDDAGTNKSGGRENSLGHLQEQIDEYQAIINEGETELSSVTSDLESAEATMQSSQDELKTLRKSQLETKAELAETKRALAALDAEWEDKYRALEQTPQIEAQLLEARQRRQEARAAALQELRDADAEYAAMVDEREQIMPRIR